MGHLLSQNIQSWLKLAVAQSTPTQCVHICILPLLCGQSEPHKLLITLLAISLLAPTCTSSLQVCTAIQTFSHQAYMCIEVCWGRHTSGAVLLLMQFQLLLFCRYQWNSALVGHFKPLLGGSMLPVVCMVVPCYTSGRNASHQYTLWRGCLPIQRVALMMGALLGRYSTNAQFTTPAAIHLPHSPLVLAAWTFYGDCFI